MTEDCNVYLQSFRSAASRERKESSSDESFISVVRDPEATIMDTPEGVLRVHKECRQLNFLYRFYHVPSDYYSWELAQRAERLRAPSEAHLCKTLIMENTKCIVDDCSDPLNSKYYCVIVPYVCRMNSPKLNVFVHSLSGGSISKKRYNMRIASEETSEQLSGYMKNSVCPLGLRTQLPTIVAQSIVDLHPDIIFLGAGHVDWKIGISAANLVDGIRALGRMVWSVDLS